PAPDPDVRRDRRRDRRPPLRAGALAAEAGARGGAGRRPLGRRPRRAGRAVQADLRGGDGADVRAGRPRAARARSRGGLPVLEHAARAGLSPRARHPGRSRTAVNVVQMVFGNKGETSGTGVTFTRNPSTGEPGLYGEFLVNAQGEDVVAGIRTPEPIERMRALLPEAFAELQETIRRLEEHYRDMQDIEFTVEEGTLYLLQTRTAKRTAAA